VNVSSTAGPVRLGPNQPTRPYRGGAGIARFRGTTASPGSYTPEDFIASTTEVFTGGGVGLSTLPDGRGLRDAVLADPLGFLGPEHVQAFGPTAGVLVKMLDTGERLFVHFHPDRAFAHQHLGLAHGKNEAWLITDVVTDPADESSGYVYLGWAQDVDLETVRTWMSNQDKAAMLGALNKVPAKPGDTFFVPAGVAHAIGGGVTMVEVQEPVDLSILLEWDGFDIDGPGTGSLGLGFDVALSALERHAWTAAQVDHAKSARAGTASAELVQLLPAEADPYFRAERIELKGDDGNSAAVLDAGFAVLVVLHGHGRVEFGEQSESVAAGDTLLIPYSAGPVRVVGALTALRCRPADPADAAAQQ
jgi:mannose-6-phosphate isomerase